MKYEIGQTVFTISSRAGLICIDSMCIYKVEKAHNIEDLIYTGDMLSGGDSDTGIYREGKLFSSRSKALNEIARQLQVLSEEL
jgi:hypothetical protein